MLWFKSIDFTLYIFFLKNGNNPSYSTFLIYIIPSFKPPTLVIPNYTTIVKTLQLVVSGPYLYNVKLSLLTEMSFLLLFILQISVIQEAFLVSL